MRILIYSRHFAPSIGGMERLMQVLAEEFLRLGHAVEVVTETPETAVLPYPVHRAPSQWQLFRLIRRSDAVLAAPLSLRRLPAMVFARRRVVVAHPVPLPRGRPYAAANWAKRMAARLVVNVVPSRYMARLLPCSIVIPNPVERGFLSGCEPLREKAGVLFVGRLIEDKGCDLLIAAFASIVAQQPKQILTVVGDGPKRAALEGLAAELGIANNVSFLGNLVGMPLIETMRAHQLMVVPSRWAEPFGIVAIEGLAAGCRMVVADTGGLPEAVGDIGLLFEAGDTASLTRTLQFALSPDDLPPDRDAVTRHLAQFDPERIARQYLALLGAS